MGIFLTADELVELTGYKAAKFQVEWLRARGWRFELNRVGRPKVDREYYRSKMGNIGAPAETVGPNWAAL